MKYFISFLILFSSCSVPSSLLSTEAPKFVKGDCSYFSTTQDETLESWEKPSFYSIERILQVGKKKYLYMMYSWSDRGEVYVYKKTDYFSYFETAEYKMDCQEALKFLKEKGYKGDEL